MAVAKVVTPAAVRADRVVRQHFSGRARQVENSTYPMWRAQFPGPSLPAVCAEHRPDVVVASIVSPPAWRSMHRYLTGAGIASVLYLRDEGAARQIRRWAHPDLVLANAHSLAALADSAGVSAVVIPSVVELDRCRVESTRQRVLFVNPIGRRGVGVVVALAHARPSIPFVIHETTPLHSADRGRLRAMVGSLPNVELRHPVADPRALYWDARILLAPYQLSNRPRVVLEAQSNAIPVLAADVPGLRECVAPGSRMVSPAAPIDDWVEALDELWDDPARYAGAAAAALQHSRRPEVQPPAIVDRFEAAMEALLAGRRRRLGGSRPPTMSPAENSSAETRASWGG